MLREPYAGALDNSVRCGCQITGAYSWGVFATRTADMQTWETVFSAECGWRYLESVDVRLLHQKLEACIGMLNDPALSQETVNTYVGMVAN